MATRITVLTSTYTATGHCEGRVQGAGVGASGGRGAGVGLRVGDVGRHTGTPTFSTASVPLAPCDGRRYDGRAYITPLGTNAPPIQLDDALARLPNVVTWSVAGSMRSTALAWSGMPKMMPCGDTTPPTHLPSAVLRLPKVVTTSLRGSMRNTALAQCGTP